MEWGRAETQRYRLQRRTHRILKVEVIPATYAASLYSHVFSSVAARIQCCQQSNSVQDKDCSIVALVVFFKYTS
jgi:hypothetical protein